MRVLLVLLAGLVAGCAMNHDPAAVTCEDNAHCPTGWWCPGSPAAPATCEEGSRLDDDDVVNDDDTMPDDDDSTPDDDDDSAADDDDTTAADDDDTTPSPDDDDSSDDDDDVLPDDDDSTPDPCSADLDGDLVPVCGPDGVGGNGDDDCDDGAALIFPGASELCDATDSDCDGSLVDEFDNYDGDAEPDCIDADDDNDFDGDGTDCDDLDASIFTGASEPYLPT